MISKGVIILTCLFAAIFLPVVRGQEVPEHISYTNIYDFLDELASDGIISINSAVKPFSKMEIGRLLLTASGKQLSLNRRQNAELVFYRKLYAIEMNSLGKQDPENYSKPRRVSTSILAMNLNYEDTILKLNVRPIAGVRMLKNENDRILGRYQGAEFSAYVGKHWGFYMNFRDCYESKPLAKDSIFTLEPGSIYIGERLTDFNEIRGGITYSWDWGSIGLVKEHFIWGDNYHGSNIFSGRTPSFAQIQLKLHPAGWLYFNYIHGWLSSNVIDSSRSYVYNGGYRKIYRNKYVAANFVTVCPLKNLDISIGNSVIYSDVNIHPAYFIPFLFYKAVDQSVYPDDKNAGMNNQVFFDISSRQIRHLHLYTSVLVDELSFTRMWNDTTNSNFVSAKFGARISDFLIPNTFFTFEYTRTNPLVYQHFIPSLSFESDGFSLGHYLRDNSQEIYLAAEWRPIRGLHLMISYTHAEHGDDYIYGDGPAFGKPFLKNITWESKMMQYRVDFEFAGKSSVFIDYQQSDVSGVDLARYTPAFYRGKTNTIQTGVNIGM